VPTGERGVEQIPATAEKFGLLYLFLFSEGRVMLLSFFNFFPCQSIG